MSMAKKAHLDALTPDELSAKKSIILETLCDEFNREAAAKAASLSMGQFRLLLAKDEEFRGQVQAIKGGDDDQIADYARKNIRYFLTNGDDRAKLTATIHADKTRGGYGNTKQAKAPAANMHPVDVKRYRDPEPAKKAEVSIKLPQEDYTETPDADLLFGEPN